MNPHCIPCIFTLFFRCHQRCSPDHDNLHRTACFFYDHDATSSVRAHRLVITSTGELSKKEVNMFAKKVKAPQENSAPALKKPLILFARSPFPFLVPVISYYFLFLVFFTSYSTIHTFHSIFYHFHFSAPCRCSLLPLIVFLFHEHSLFLSLSPPHSTSSFALSLTANLEKKLHELDTIIVCGPANHVLNLQ